MTDQSPNAWFLADEKTCNRCNHAAGRAAAALGEAAQQAIIG
jgi:hypothetical protein